jgi:hypothetical protein
MFDFRCWRQLFHIHLVVDERSIRFGIVDVTTSDIKGIATVIGFRGRAIGAESSHAHTVRRGAASYPGDEYQQASKQPEHTEDQDGASSQQVTWSGVEMCRRPYRQQLKDRFRTTDWRKAGCTPLNCFTVTIPHYALDPLGNNRSACRGGLPLVMALDRWGWFVQYYTMRHRHCRWVPVNANARYTAKRHIFMLLLI